MNIDKRPGPARTGVYIVIDEITGKYCGKIIYAYPKDGAGILYASLWDWTDQKSGGRDIQNGRATGYGYDKQSAAIDGFKFGTDDREFILDCDGTGMNTAIDQFKKKGYLLQWVI